jgi:DNA-binding LytR/AlgR family response regulator
MEMLETRGVRSRVVLTTAHQEYAAKAYDLDVIDYLVKPFAFERFAQAVQRVHATLGERRPVPRDFIFVKTELRLERVRLADIVAIEGQRDYRRIHTTSKRIMTLQTFGDFERLISPEIVCRVHKSYMVALDKIESIERGEIRIRNFRIPISDTYRERLFVLIGQRASSLPTVHLHRSADRQDDRGQGKH